MAGNWKFENDGGGIKLVSMDEKEVKDAGGNAGGLGDGMQTSGNVGLKAEKKVSGYKALGGLSTRDETGEDDDLPEGSDYGKGDLATKTLAKGKGGKLMGGVEVLALSGEASVSAGIDKDGIAIKGAAGAKFTLIGGELVYTTPEKEFSFLGEKFKGHLGAKLTAEVAAEAKGEVGIAGTVKDGKMEVGLGAKAEAFAGARAGFSLFSKLSWIPEGEEATDVAAASVGVEGFAGAAAKANIACSLIPEVKISADVGVAVGIGGGLKFELMFNAISVAKLIGIFVSKGAKYAWEGAKKYAGLIGAWIKTKGASFKEKMRSFWKWLKGSDDIALQTVKDGQHEFASAATRGQLIKDLDSGLVTFASEESAIVSILQVSKDKGDLQQVVDAAGGSSKVLKPLGGSRRSKAKNLLKGLS